MSSIPEKRGNWSFFYIEKRASRLIEIGNGPKKRKSSHTTEAAVFEQNHIAIQENPWYFNNWRWGTGNHPVALPLRFICLLVPRNWSSREGESVNSGPLLVHKRKFPWNMWKSAANTTLYRKRTDSFSPFFVYKKVKLNTRQGLACPETFFFVKIDNGLKGRFNKISARRNPCREEHYLTWWYVFVSSSLFRILIEH